MKRYRLILFCFCYRNMRQQVWGLIFLAVLINFGECRSLVKRQINSDASLDPALEVSIKKKCKSVSVLSSFLIN